MSEAAYEIDLHGRKVEAALRFLEAELTYCRARRMTPVLVIVGRGWHSPGQRPVLGPAVKDWLLGPKGQGLGVAKVTPRNQGGALSIDLRR